MVPGIPVTLTVDGYGLAGPLVETGAPDGIRMGLEFENSRVVGCGVGGVVGESLPQAAISTTATTWPIRTKGFIGSPPL
jgi:hypothetical protein